MENNIWIPVSPETMPKPDNRVFIAFENSYKRLWTTIAYHLPKFSKEVEYDYEGQGDSNEADGKEYWPEGWYEWAYEADIHYVLEGEVTHWMALPKRPEESL